MTMTYTVLKQSGTYAETLEWLGFSYFLEKLCGELYRNEDVQITLHNEPHQYCVSINREITQADLAALPYFWVLPFIRKETKMSIPDGLPIAELRDYPKQKGIRDERKAQREAVQKDKALSGPEQKKRLSELNEYFKSELAERLDLDFDVYSIIRGNNPYPSYFKLYTNFESNRKHFELLVWEILSYYTIPNSKAKSNVKAITTKVTAQQLYAPNQGKGLNREKADGPKAGNLDGFWIPETMKVAGALQTMFCQYVKVGTGYDLKVNVPEFNDIEHQQVDKLLSGFKQSLSSNSAIKVDILNVLSFCKVFIENSPEYKSNSGWRRINITNSVNGFHSVIQKDLGQNRAVVNMSFLGVPTFIEYQNADEAQQWITILNEQHALVRNIEEQGESIDGLRAYRSFLSGSDLTSFFQFTTFYSTYLMHELTDKRSFIKPFSTEHLNQFFTSMSTENVNLRDIINDPGFQSIAKAIRKSTVSLQMAKRKNPNKKLRYPIRYGMAQELQVKSKSKTDLATFIGEFVTTYNAENARYQELHPTPSDEEKYDIRALVKDAELLSFYSLLDNPRYPSRLVGALLGSYGFALTAKERPVLSQTGTQIIEDEPNEVTETEETDLDF